jgi:hypothetical protein
MSKRSAKTAEFSPGSEAPSFKKSEKSSNKTANTTYASASGGEFNKFFKKAPPVINPVINPNPNASEDNDSDNTATNFNTPASSSTPRERPYRFERPVVYGQDPLHTSMNNLPEVPPNLVRHNPILSPPIDKVILDIYKKDTATFEDLLPRDDLKFIWTHHLGRNIEEVRIMVGRVATGCLKVIYKLKAETTLIEITKSHEIEFELKIGSKIHTFSAKFPQFKEITCELNKLISITIYKIPHEIDCEDIREWLQLFGELKSNFRYNIYLIFINYNLDVFQRIFLDVFRRTHPKTLISAIFLRRF